MKKTTLFTFIAVSVIMAGAVYLAIYSVYWKPADQKAAKQDQSGQNKFADDVEIPDLNSLPKQKTVKPISETDHFDGDLNAPVQIIVYSDFSCPFCAEFSDELNKVKAQFGSRAVIAFRHFPLQSHLQGIPAAVAAECAADQGKFWEMYSSLFASNKAGELNEEGFKKDVEEIGLDMDKFNECAQSEKIKDKIIASIAEGREMGILGTPTVFINKMIFPGAWPYDDFTGSDGEKLDGMKTVVEKLLVQS